MYIHVYWSGTSVEDTLVIGFCLLKVPSLHMEPHVLCTVEPHFGGRFFSIEGSLPPHGATCTCMYTGNLSRGHFGGMFSLLKVPSLHMEPHVHACILGTSVEDTLVVGFSLLKVPSLHMEPHVHACILGTSVEDTLVVGFSLLKVPSLHMEPHVHTCILEWNLSKGYFGMFSLLKVPSPHMKPHVHACILGTSVEDTLVGFLY